MDRTFRALADPTRRELLDRLSAKSGLTVGEIGEGLEMSRQAVGKHLAILEEANLVVVRSEGRERRLYLNPVPIHEIAERWIRKYELPRLDALAELKRRLENEP